MDKSIQIVYLLKNVATGILASVLTLTLLQHGADIHTVSLFIGLFSFVVILFEFPSGVFADVFGRKTSFLLSCVLYILSYSLILASSSAVSLACAIVFNGLGRAFSSGSIDALTIDQSTDNDQSLEWVTSRLAILESVGLSIGALSGGFLAGIGTRYQGNLIANIAIYVLLIVMTAGFIREKRPHSAPVGLSATLRQFRVQTKDSLSFLRTGGIVSILFVFALITGLALSSLETYWQPSLQAMQSADWVFGVVSFSGFAVVIFGSLLAERILTKFGAQGVRLLLACKALLGVALIALMFQAEPVSFIAVYLLAYLFIGCGSVAESTLLNRLAPSSHRAGILSLSSFVLQLGGLIAALCGYFISSYSRFQNIWLLAGAFLLTCSLIFALLKRRSPNHLAPNASHQPSSIAP